MACDASLRILQTDRVDLMQIHWLDRYVPVFGQTEFKHGMVHDDAVAIEETVKMEPNYSLATDVRCSQ